MSKKKTKKQRKPWKQRPVAVPARKNKSDEPPARPDGSRKRIRSHVEFVYPKDSSSERKQFLFDKQRKSQSGFEQQSEQTSETLDDILSSKSGRKKHNEIELEGGKLSGLSVEDAIRDKLGCRPRANSTDGELKLPRRGLCDERMVLEAHKWKSFLTAGPPKGFKNLGNTCYLNSTLQCLAYLPTFSQTIMSLPVVPKGGNGRKPTKGQRITSMLSALFRQVHGVNGGTGTDRAISPHGVVRAVPNLGSGGSRSGYNFRPGQQEDAHEFLVHLLDAMQDGELRAAGINQHASGWRDRLPIPRLDETTFINRIFGGYLRSQVRCTKCGYCSNTYDPFLDLSLEVSKKSSSSVASAFSEFTRKETLDSRNRWKCSGCKKHVCALKQLTVFRPPLSLCIQLKRFTYGGGFGSFGTGWGFGHYAGKGMGISGRGGSKISKPIEFPAELKLPLSDGRTCEYNLTGVVIHIGSSASSGHYTAFVKKPGDASKNQWYHMDDSFVEPVSEKTVLKQRDAYVLFYCRKEVKVEYPSPPPRGFESAEAARESGVARARARSSSLDLGQFTPKDEIATQVALKSVGTNPLTSSDVSSSGGMKMKSDKSAPPLHTPKPTEVSEPADGAATRPSAQSKDSSISGDSSSSSSSSSNSSDSGNDSSSSESTGSDSSEPSNQEGGDGRTTISEAMASNAQNALHKSSSGNDTSKGDAEEDNNKLSMNMKIDDKTRVVIDRGGTRGKLEVMLGPRRGAKAWKPKASSSLDSKNELLGSVKVSKWGDDEGDEEDSDTLGTQHSQLQSEKRINVLKELDRQDRSRKRKMHLDGWNAMLDEGKVCGFNIVGRLCINRSLSYYCSSLPWCRPRRSKRSTKSLQWWCLSQERTRSTASKVVCKE